MPESSPEGWSSPKFFAIALVVTFVVMFTLNGVFNELLGWGVSTTYFSIASSLILVLFLLPRWHYWKKRTAPKTKG
jgi:Cu/Ag efflux pump CusA